MSMLHMTKLAPQTWCAIIYTLCQAPALEQTWLAGCKAMHHYLAGLPACFAWHCLTKMHIRVLSFWWNTMSYCLILHVQHCALHHAHLRRHCCNTNSSRTSRTTTKSMMLVLVPSPAPCSSITFLNFVIWQLCWICLSFTLHARGSI